MGGCETRMKKRNLHSSQEEQIQNDAFERKVNILDQGRFENRIRSSHRMDDKREQQCNNNSKIIGTISLEQIENVYDSSKDNDQFFNNLSEQISEVYIDLSAEALQLMNKKKIDHSESKLFISERVLLMNLLILQTLGRKKQNGLGIDTFRKLNKAQNIMLGYLKMKYPRIGTSYVPDDLAKQFKEFSMVENIDNDMLRSAEVCFTDQNEKAISKQLKELINKFIHELDNKFMNFKGLLQDKVFMIQTQEGKQKKLEYKIGRKLPQNVSKLNLSDDEEFTITSPEIFRVIIKWVTDMQKLITCGEEQIKEKQSFKTYIENQGLQLDDIGSGGIKNLVPTLVSALKDIKIEYQREMQELMDEMDRFNINLLKILDKTERNQKYVPKNQTKVIKYAMYNTKLVSWFLIRQLIFLIKNLIKVGKSVKGKINEICNIDLIKFNVTDLMRAMVSGNKKQILMVYSKLKWLEEDQQIKIIKIKNRFGTPLNDAMIIFTIKESYIICELQLILIEGSGASDKLKNIEFLNHFLYELERSPYGVLSELAVVLGYKDSKVKYEKKITFHNTLKVDFSTCQQSHPVEVKNKEVQYKPFLCTKCTIFYNPLESILGYKFCQKCNTYICCRCFYMENKIAEKQEINRRFFHEISNMISERIMKEYYQSEMMNIINKERYFLKEELKKNYQDIKMKDIKIIVKKYSQKQLISLDGREGALFLFVRFKGLTTYVRFLFWNNNIGQIEEPLDNQKFSEVRNPCTSFYDYIVFLNKKLEPREYDIAKIEKNYKIALCPKDINYRGVKKLWACVIGVRDDFKQKDKVSVKRGEVMSRKDQKMSSDSENQNQILLVVKVATEKKFHLEGLSNEFEVLAQKKIFPYDSLEKARNNLPELTIVKENFTMQNMGIITPLIDNYFSTKKSEAIKHMNLNDNLIKDASIIFQIETLESIYLSKNFLTELNIKKSLPNLRKLFAFDNQIIKIEGLNKLYKLKHLNLSDNKIVKLENLQLRQLRQLLLANNEWNSLESFSTSQFDSLENIDISRSQNIGERFKNLVIPHMKIKKINSRKTQIESLEIKSPNLEYLECSSCGISFLKFVGKKLQYLYVNQNYLVNFGSIFKQNLNCLEILHAKKLNETKFSRELPILQSERLEEIQFNESLFLECEGKLQQWKLPNLRKLDLGHFKSQKSPVFPYVNLAGLKQFNYPITGYSSILNLQRSNLENIRFLHLIGNPEKSQECPIFDLPSIEKLELFKFNFHSFQKMGDKHINLQKVKYILLSELLVDNLPALNFPCLRQLDIKFLTVKKGANISDFSKSNFSHLQKLNLTGKMFREFPILSAPQLQILNFSQPFLEDFKGIDQCSFDKLEFLYIVNCYNLTNTIFPEINFSNLKMLSIVFCNISSMEKLKHSDVPQLERIHLHALKLRRLPVLRLFNLKQFQCFNPIFDEDYYEQMKRYHEFHPKQENSSDKVQLDSSLSNQPHEFGQFDYNNRKYFEIKKQKQILDVLLEDITPLGSWICPQLAMLNFKGNKIRFLPKISFPKLIKLDLDENPIEQILPFRLSSLPALRNFTGNNIKTQVFPFSHSCIYDTYILTNTKVKELNSLYLSHFFVTKLIINYGQISTVDFSVLQKMTYLDLSHNKIQSLYYKIPFAYTVIKQLYLNKNRITEWKIFQLTELQILSLSDNSLKKFIIPEGRFKKLRQVIITWNSLEKIGKLTQPNLEKINFANNQLKAVDFFNSKFHYQNLKEIILNNNAIKKISHIPDAELWNLASNKIDSLNWVESCPTERIKILKLEDNQIKDITSLQYLNLTSLKELDLSMNEITALPDKKIKALKLVKLNLSENRLKQFIGGSDVLPSIEDLNISFNRLEKFSCSSRSLLVLKLSFNYLKTIEKIKISSLEELILNDNEIADIEWLKESKWANLINIYLHSNRISQFPDMNHFPALISLSLGDNPLHTFNSLFDLEVKNPINMEVQYSLSSEVKQSQKLEIIDLMKKKIREPIFMGRSQYEGKQRNNIVRFVQREVSK